MFTCFFLGVGIGLLIAALLITVYELTTSTIRQKVKEELPESSYVIIEKITKDRGCKVFPTYKAKAYNRTGKKLRDIDFKYEKSEYFYDGEKIYI